MTCKRCGAKMWKKGKVRSKYQWRCSVCGHTFLVSKEEYMKRVDPQKDDGPADMDPYSKQLFEACKRLKLTPEEAKRVLKGLMKPDTSQMRRPVIDHPDKHVRFGVIADEHIGHKCFREDVLDHATSTFKKEPVDFVLNVGDTLEGMSGREGHIYELSHRGYSEQMKEFRKQFEKFGDIPVYSIEAQNSHSGWFNSKANAGVDIGEELEKDTPYVFMGYNKADLKLDSGLTIRLVHPGGGTAYAISYKAQKYLDSLSGGKKPHMIFQGHFHKAMYLYYRNVHFFDAGCLQEQTLFMEQIRTPAMLGYWVIDVNYNKTNWCCDVTPKFYPFYE